MHEFMWRYARWIYHLVSQRERAEASSWHVSPRGSGVGSAEFKSHRLLRLSFFGVLLATVPRSSSLVLTALVFEAPFTFDREPRARVRTRAKFEDSRNTTHNAFTRDSRSPARAFVLAWKVSKGHSFLPGDIRQRNHRFFTWLRIVRPTRKALRRIVLTVHEEINSTMK